ncbi:glycosyltransferase [Vibrio parahaemolyticus]|uniref:glycosyltransferase family 2 protein n=1 Tax=Vibrio parahaemolyticus TaxID=670 RepID=UPI00215CC1BB|nr:glycosyltransferase family 2 protein [Vibrio parahaemolyticus]MCS0049301.1 glycosyltransferase [Vibrio parahaemolyticus]
MNLIVIFNYNYSDYLGKLIDTIGKNELKRFKVILCDDGSDDASLLLFNEIKTVYTDMNLELVKVRGFNSGARDIKSHGQISALNKVFDIYGNCITDSSLVCLVDADDYYPDGYFSQLESCHRKENFDVYLSKINNVNQSAKSIGYKNIVRPIGSTLNIWPTVTCTSGIAVTKRFIERNREAIFNFEKKFADVWLDARICMLANYNSKVLYSEQEFYRLIHGANDSMSTNFVRKLDKQIQSALFYSKYSKFKGVRVILLVLLSKLIWLKY